MQMVVSVDDRLIVIAVVASLMLWAISAWMDVLKARKAAGALLRTESI